MKLNLSKTQKSIDPRNIPNTPNKKKFNYSALSEIQKLFEGLPQLPPLQDSPYLQTKLPAIILPKDIKESITNARGNPNNTIAYTHDQSNRLVWLESGNMYMTDKGEKGAGFWHIENRHMEQFKSRFSSDLNETKMIDICIDVVKNGKCEPKYIKNKLGEEIYVGNNYTKNKVLVYAGENGFIVGSRPTK
jgi:hypothetical protein